MVTERPKEFVEAMINVNYKFVSKVHLKLLQKYSNFNKITDANIKKEGHNFEIFRNWVMKIQELAMANNGIHE